MNSTSWAREGTREPSRIRRVVERAAAFGYFGLGGAVLGHVIVPLARVGARDEWDAVRRSQRVVARGTRHYLRVMRRLGRGEVDATAYAEAIPDGPCVVVANHPTLVDVIAFLAEHPNLCVVVKGTLFRSVMLGRMLRQCGHIDAGEGTRLDGAAVIQASEERLRRGFSVLIFPEGTRSPAGGLHQLKRGAFDLAVRAKVPILPVLLRSDPPALMKGVPWWRSTPEGTFTLTLTPLPLQAWEPWEGRSRLFRKHVHRMIREGVMGWHRGRDDGDDCGPGVTGGRAEASPATSGATERNLIGNHGR